jgi:hypothetical protein
VKLYPMRASWEGVAPGTPEEVEARLQAAIEARELLGKVGGGRFSLTAPVRGRKNSWRPVLTGRLTPAGDHTWIEVDASVHPFVLVFTLVHGMMLLGIAWVMGLLAFSWEVPGAFETLARSAGAFDASLDELLAKQELPAPFEPGAELRAPWSLRAEPRDGEVSFTLRGPARMGRRRRRKLVVGPSGLQVDRERVAWGELRGVRAGAGALVVELANRKLRILAPDHPERDLTWLADFLTFAAGETGVGTAAETRLRREAAALTEGARARPDATRGREPS